MAIVIPAYSYAQTLGLTKKAPSNIVRVSVQDKIENKAKNINSNASSKNKDISTDEDVVEEEVPPTTITPDEIIAFETESKKAIRRSLKNRDTNDRGTFIGVMSAQEKSIKVKELMLEGKNYKEAKKIAEEMMKIPSVDLKKDKDIENYIYQKGGFISK